MLINCHLESTDNVGVFGVPLETLVERYGSDSQQGASNSTMRVPEFIEEIIATMRQMGECRLCGNRHRNMQLTCIDMAIEGIFRKNGNIRRLQQISEALDKDSTNVNLSEENPVQLAALLKRFLRELPDPLLTFKLHKLFCAAACECLLMGKHMSEIGKSVLILQHTNKWKSDSDVYIFSSVSCPDTIAIQWKFCSSFSNGSPRSHTRMKKRALEWTWPI